MKLEQTQMQVGQKLVIDPLGANSGDADGDRPSVRRAAGGTGVSFATPLAFAHAAGVRVDLFAHRLTDTLIWNWNNTCVSDPDDDCTTNEQLATAGASSISEVGLVDADGYP